MAWIGPICQEIHRRLFHLLTNTHPMVPPLNPIPSEQTLMFKQISYDLIMGLPMSNGFNALLAMVNHGLSKGVILCPTKKNITTDGTTVIIFQKLYAHFGLFNKVISDHGPQFTANFAKELSCILGYEISLSTAYHPQTDGETERLNQQIETYLCIFYSSHPKTWVKHIPMAECVHNHHPHSTTSKSPFYLMLGYEPQAVPNIIETAHLPALEEQLRNHEKARNEALSVHKLAQQVISSPNLPLLKSTIRFGLRPETSSGASLTQNSHQKEKDPSLSHGSHHPYHMNSNSLTHGKSTLCSICHSSPPIMRMKFMA